LADDARVTPLLELLPRTPSVLWRDGRHRTSASRLLSIRHWSEVSQCISRICSIVFADSVRVDFAQESRCVEPSEHGIVSCRGHFANSGTLWKAPSARTLRGFWPISESFRRVCQEYHRRDLHPEAVLGKKCCARLYSRSLSPGSTSRLFFEWGRLPYNVRRGCRRCPSIASAHCSSIR
jgi:hypothetical protein